jgi:hypothetical protein
VAWEGLTNTEIAVVLGCPRLVVGARLHRARQRFRTALATRDVTGPETRTDCAAQVPHPITVEDRCPD